MNKNVSEAEKAAKEKRKAEFLKKNSNIQRVITLLEKKRIVVEEDFWEQCAESLRHSHRSARALSEEDVNQVIEIANFWKEAVLNDEEFVKLIEGIICRLYQVQCVCITNNYNCPKLYLGRFARLNESELASPKTHRFKRTRYNLGEKWVLDEF